MMDDVEYWNEVFQKENGCSEGRENLEGRSKTAPAMVVEEAVVCASPFMSLTLLMALLHQRRWE